jgi:hypothetical protein
MQIFPYNLSSNTFNSRSLLSFLQNVFLHRESTAKFWVPQRFSTCGPRTTSVRDDGTGGPQADLNYIKLKIIQTIQIQFK